MLQRFRRQRVLISCIVAAAAASFLLAANYCSCEALMDGHSGRAGAHHHDRAGHHDHDGDQPSNDRSDPCCSTLHAIPTPLARLLLTTPSQTLLLRLPASAVAPLALALLTQAPTGLSPPAPAPWPQRPFYRTTFASHAPPAPCLG